MTGKNRRHYHCKALNSLLCADVPLRNYSLTHSPIDSGGGFYFSKLFLVFRLGGPDHCFCSEHVMSCSAEPAYVIVFAHLYTSNVLFLTSVGFTIASYFMSQQSACNIVYCSCVGYLIFTIRIRSYCTLKIVLS